jgi:hypothetical protein
MMVRKIIMAMMHLLAIQPIRTSTYLGTGNGRQRIASELNIDIATRQIINNDDVVALIGQIQRRRPSAKAITAQHQDFLVAAAITIRRPIRLDQQCRGGEEVVAAAVVAGRTTTSPAVADDAGGRPRDRRKGGRNHGHTGTCQNSETRRGLHDLASAAALAAASLLLLLVYRWTQHTRPLSREIERRPQSTTCRVVTANDHHPLFFRLWIFAPAGTMNDV